MLPQLAGYFAWRPGIDVVSWVWLALAFVAAGVFANVFPFAERSDTVMLTALHLPIALWLVVGIAYTRGAMVRRQGADELRAFLR